VTAVLAGWVGRVVVLLVAAAVVELALPSGALRRYVEVVVGLVVLVTVLHPILDWFGADLGAAAAAVEARLARDLGAVAAGSPYPADAAGSARFDAALRRAFAARIEEGVRQGLAAALGIEARVEVTLGDGPAGRGAPRSDPPPLERVLVRVTGAGDGPPRPGGPGVPRALPTGSGEAVRVQVPVVVLGPVRAPGVPAPDALDPRSAGGLPAQVRAWVAEALGIDAARVAVVFGEEVEP